jgi:hypothetical protein
MIISFRYFRTLPVPVEPDRHPVDGVLKNG